MNDSVSKLVTPSTTVLQDYMLCFLGTKMCWRGERRTQLDPNSSRCLTIIANLFSFILIPSFFKRRNLLKQFLSILQFFPPLKRWFLQSLGHVLMSVTSQSAASDQNTNQITSDYLSVKRTKVVMQYLSLVHLSTTVHILRYLLPITTLLSSKQKLQISLKNMSRESNHTYSLHS